MGRALLAAGGWAHPGDDLVEAVGDLLKPRGFEPYIVRDADSFAHALGEPFDLLVVGACWFSMSDARYTENQRAEHAIAMTPLLADALRSARDAGCPLLALHTAVICFDDFEPWSSWLGGAWNWQTSFHPPPEQVEVRPGGQSELLLESFEPFAVTDELYQGLDLADAVNVVAQSTHGHPLAWLHETSRGRSAVNVLGHDSRSLADPNHERLNQQLMHWLLDKG